MKKIKLGILLCSFMTLCLPMVTYADYYDSDSGDITVEALCRWTIKGEWHPR